MARLVAFVALACIAVFSLSRGQALTFTVNKSNTTGSWDHYWERCHAWTGLRADWQSQMRQTHADLGFQQVRMHGVFVDDMSVVLPGDNGGVQYSFFNVDQVYDFLTSIGMKPYVELSFMPDLLASGNQTWSHYLANITPPKTWQSWADLITAFVQHLVDRYGVEEIRTWNFEVWNEPNCCPSFFWTDGQAGYFELYNWTSRAVKSVDSQIPVGGPTTAMSQWIPEFITYCKDNNVPFDFIATHEYPTDPPGPQTRDFFKNVLQTTRNTVGSLPLYYSEYDDGYDDDTSYAAAFAVYQVFAVHGIVDILSWWPFSDIFEEQGLYSMPFNAPVAGLQNIYGVPKPSYRAFQLLHWTGDHLLDVSPTYDVYPTVGAFAVGGNHTSIFVFNWNVMNQPIANETVELTVTGLLGASKAKAQAYRIDSVNANAMPLWIQMGQPQYLLPKQVAQLGVASELVVQTMPFTVVNNSTIVFNFTVEPQALINIIVHDKDD